VAEALSGAARALAEQMAIGAKKTRAMPLRIVPRSATAEPVRPPPSFRRIRRTVTKTWRRSLSAIQRQTMSPTLLK
jgi:hypothetical protein